MPAPIPAPIPTPISPHPIDAAAQARELSSLFLQLSIATDQFRHDHIDELEPAMRTQLKNQAQHLDDLSDHYTAIAIGATLRTIQDDLDNIKAVTAQAQRAVQTIQRVDQVVSIVSAAVTLGSAIFAGDTATIGTAVSALTGAVTGDTATQTATPNSD